MLTFFYFYWIKGQRESAAATKKNRPKRKNRRKNLATMEEAGNWLATFGSSFPHITFALQSLPVPAVFNMSQPPYVESLMFLGILPLMYLLLIMIILMIYYCCIGFSLKVKSDEKQSCCSASVGFYITSAILILLTSLGGLYGAVMLCAPAQEKIGDSIDNLKTDELGADLKNVTSSFAAVQDSLRAIQLDVLTDLGQTKDAQSFQEISDQFVAYQNPLPSVNNTAGMAKMNEYIGTVEDHRYWWSIGLFSLFALLSIMSMFGVCFKSKGMLIGMTCVSFFTLVLCDLSLSVQLSVGVALSDYCQNPAAAQENFIQMPDCVDQSDASNNAQSEKLKQLVSASKELTSIMGRLISTKQTVDPRWTGFKTSINALVSIADSYNEQLDCTFVTQEYQKITESLCSDYIVGWWTVLAASVAISLFFTQLVMFAPCVWRRFDPETMDGFPYKDDEDIPFVRPATFQQPTYPQTRQSVTLNYLCQSNDELNFSDTRPPQYSSFS